MEIWKTDLVGEWDILLVIIVPRLNVLCTPELIKLEEREENSRLRTTARQMRSDVVRVATLIPIRTDDLFGAFVPSTVALKSMENEGERIVLWSRGLEMVKHLIQNTPARTSTLISYKWRKITNVTRINMYIYIYIAVYNFS